MQFSPWSQFQFSEFNIAISKITFYSIIGIISNTYMIKDKLETILLYDMKSRISNGANYHS